MQTQEGQVSVWLSWGCAKHENGPLPMRRVQARLLVAAHGRAGLREMLARQMRQTHPEEGGAGTRPRDPQEHTGQT